MPVSASQPRVKIQTIARRLSAHRRRSQDRPLHPAHPNSVSRILCDPTSLSDPLCRLFEPETRIWHHVRSPTLSSIWRIPDSPSTSDSARVPDLRSSLPSWAHPHAAPAAAPTNKASRSIPTETAESAWTCEVGPPERVLSPGLIHCWLRS